MLTKQCIFLLIVLFTVVCSSFKFKGNSCQQTRNVEMFVVDGQGMVGDQTFRDQILKHYFQPLNKEQNKYKYCFNLSVNLFSGDRVSEVSENSEDIKALLSRGNLYTANGVLLISNEASYYWRFLLMSLDSYVNTKIDTLVVFVRYFPPAFINKLYELKYKWHINVVLIIHYFRYSYIMKFYHFGNNIHEQYDRLPHKLVSGYYYDDLAKTLLGVIRRPEHNRYEFIRNIPKPQDTNCLANTTVAILYKPFGEYFCFEDWFVELMVWLESLLVVNNLENNVKLHFFINGPVSLGLTGLRYKHKITRLRNLAELSASGEKKVVLTTYLEKYEYLFERVNLLLERYKLPAVGFVVRKKEINAEYKAPFRKNNIIDVGIGETSSKKATDLLVDSLKEAGC